MVDSLIVLYEEDTTEFPDITTVNPRMNNGLGLLPDAIKCTVTEEINNSYELEMEYPITGLHYKDLKNKRILYVKTRPYDIGDAYFKQAFRIYKISKPIDGIVTVSAEHISYDLSGYPMNQPEASSDPEREANEFATMKQAIDLLKDSQNALLNSEQVMLDCPFEFIYVTPTPPEEIDENKEPNKFTSPTSIRSFLGSQPLQKYDFEYIFDAHRVTVLKERGTDRNVYLKTGKNLKDLTQEEDGAAKYTGAYPYYYNDEELVVLEPEEGEESEDDPRIIYFDGHTKDDPYNRIFLLDLTNEFDEAPEPEELRKKAMEYIEKNKVDQDKVTLSLSYIPYSKLVEYFDSETLDRISLGDTLHVFSKDLGINVVSRCTSVTYNVLTNSYDTIKLGDAEASLAETIASARNQIEQINTELPDAVRKAAMDAAETLTGGRGGYVVFNTWNEEGREGQPDEIIITSSTPNYREETHGLWIWNKNGLGFKQTYNSEVTKIALTKDGMVQADTMVAGTITGGTITGATINGGTINGTTGINIGETETPGQYNFTVNQNGNVKAATVDLTSGTIGGINFRLGQISTDSIVACSLKISGTIEANQMNVSDINITGTINGWNVSDFNSVYSLSAKLLEDNIDVSNSRMTFSNIYAKESVNAGKILQSPIINAGTHNIIPKTSDAYNKIDPMYYTSLEYSPGNVIIDQGRTRIIDWYERHAGSQVDLRIDHYATNNRFMIIKGTIMCVDCDDNEQDFPYDMDVKVYFVIHARVRSYVNRATTYSWDKVVEFTQHFTAGQNRAEVEFTYGVLDGVNDSQYTAGQLNVCNFDQTVGSMSYVTKGDGTQLNTNFDPTQFLTDNYTAEAPTIITNGHLIPGQITGNIQNGNSRTPTTITALDLGSSTKPWNNIYVNTIHAATFSPTNLTVTNLTVSGTLTLGQTVSISSYNLGVENELTLGQGSLAPVVIKNSGGSIEASATILPSTTGNKSLGSPTKKWYSVYATTLDVDNLNLSTAAIGTIAGISTNPVSISSNLLPSTNIAISLGSTSMRWANIYTDDANLNRAHIDYIYTDGIEPLTAQGVTISGVTEFSDSIVVDTINSYSTNSIGFGNHVVVPSIYIGDPTHNTGGEMSSHTIDGYIGVGNVAPMSDDTNYLGHSSYRWAAVYSRGGVITTSDKKQKEKIDYSMKKYAGKLYELKPASFIWKNIKDKKEHLGLIAQDVEKVLGDAGMIDNVDGTYGLNYAELHALEIFEIQRLEARIRELETQLKEIQNGV